MKNTKFEIYFDDCFDVMSTMPDKSVDFVLCDPPFGTTRCHWDSVLDLDRMWSELKRIGKKDSVFCLFGGQPFTSVLICSNLKDYRYSWVWDKVSAGNGILAKKQPLKIHEDIIIFNQGRVRYFPLMVDGKRYKRRTIKDAHGLFSGAGIPEVKGPAYSSKRYPKSILRFGLTRQGRVHPTQKPVELLEYLVRTYSLEGETVLDFTMGSGSTGVACQNLGRYFIGIERDAKYFDIAKDRLLRGCK